MAGALHVMIGRVSEKQITEKRQIEIYTGQGIASEIQSPSTY